MVKYFLVATQNCNDSTQAIKINYCFSVLRIIIKKRTEMEYKLQRRVVEKEDFLKYLKVW